MTDEVNAPMMLTGCLKEELTKVGAELVHFSSNRKFERDYERALPPISVRLTVKGGKKKDIGLIIWNLIPLGVLTVGNTKVKIKDSEGFTHKIYFEKV